MTSYRFHKTLSQSQSFSTDCIHLNALIEGSPVALFFAAKEELLSRKALNLAEHLDRPAAASP